MARVVVDVMLKPEILDPQGQAVQRALPRLGFEGISDVRQGKRFELEVDGPVDEAALARIHDLAESFLANTVIEDFTVKVESESRRGGREVTARIGVVTFPGSLDDRDTQRAIRLAGAEARRRCGTGTRTSTRSTPWCCAAVSPTATICGPAPSRASRP